MNFLMAVVMNKDIKIQTSIRLLLNEIVLKRNQ